MGGRVGDGGERGQPRQSASWGRNWPPWRPSPRSAPIGQAKSRTPIGSLLLKNADPSFVDSRRMHKGEEGRFLLNMLTRQVRVEISLERGSLPMMTLLRYAGAHR